MSENVLLLTLTGVTVHWVNPAVMVNAIASVTVLIAAVKAAGYGAQWI
ncbi:MAG: hypothetical protein KAG53_10340 [Endozoicomonadaceae bacterium]|nr:hypothetical protein [Endozoicomonadaceae bacterium]